MTFKTSEVAVCCSSDSESSCVRCLHLVEQTHVLDCNHRLVGKCCYKLNLLGRKWLRRLSCHGHDADAASLSEQWDA